MDEIEILKDLFDRVGGHVHGVVDDLDTGLMLATPVPGTNTIAWLIWHLARIQDHHVCGLTGEDQAWVTDDWAARFGLAADPTDTGYGHSAEQVAGVRPDGPGVLGDYYDAVALRTYALLDSRPRPDLDRVVDRRWDPPVTMGVRLVSVADDDIQHAGQAAYLKGQLMRQAAIPRLIDT